MPELGFPDRHHVHAAEGWLELGDSAEASRELRQVSRPGLAHPDALEVQWRLHAARGQWDAALDVARSMTRTAPERAAGWIHAGYCLHELRRTDEAWEMLSAQADRFPSETIIAYNLACYACQLGRATDARTWIQRAMKLGGKGPIRAMGLDDPDLLPIRHYLESL